MFFSHLYKRGSVTNKMGEKFFGFDEEQWFFLILFILILIYVANIKSYEALNTVWPTIIMIIFGLERGYISLTPREEYQKKPEDAKVSTMTVAPNETESGDLAKTAEWEDTRVGVDDLLKHQEVKHINSHHMGEVDIDFYMEGKPIQDLHQHMGSVGDTRLTNRMKYSSIQAKESHDSWARMNSEKMRRIYESELQEHENRDWWDAEQDYLDEYM